PSAWNNIALIMRNKSDLDTLSMDDLYSNLKVTNETVNTAQSVYAASSKDQASTASYADVVMFPFFANQFNALQLDNEDLEQIDANDLEEIDLKWQVAEEGLTNFALMAFTSQGSSSSDSEVDTYSKDCYQMGLESLEARIVVHEMNEAVYEENIKILNAKDKTGLGYDGQINESELNNIHMNESEVVHSVFNIRESDVDDNPVNDRFKTGKRFHVVPPPYTGNYMPPRPDLSFDGLDESVFKSAVRKTTTSVPETETSISKTSKDIVKKLKLLGLVLLSLKNGPLIMIMIVCSDLNLIRQKQSLLKSILKENTHRQVEYPRKSQSPREKPVLNNKGMVTGQREIRPVWNNAQRVNHQNKLTHPHPKRNFVPIAVATKSGQVPVNAAKQSSPRTATSISTTRPGNTVAPKPKVNDALPITYYYFQAYSTVKKPINKIVSAVEGNWGNVVKSSASWIWRPIGNFIDHTSKDSGSYMLKRFDYIDL
ncbi:hypothetical protein Tco_1454751, partial [Tanacetum coccineum]